MAQSEVKSANLRAARLSDSLRLANEFFLSHITSAASLPEYTSIMGTRLQSGWRLPQDRSSCMKCKAEFVRTFVMIPAQYMGKLIETSGHLEQH